MGSGLSVCCFVASLDRVRTDRRAEPLNTKLGGFSSSIARSFEEAARLGPKLRGTTFRARRSNEI